MHQPSPDQARRLWLLSGTGEGPPLAAQLLAQGWRLRVSVVTPAAALAYRPHPHLEVRWGALNGVQDILAMLRSDSGPAAGPAFRWVVDATHPFATEISHNLSAACGQAGQPLLRLQRPAVLPDAGALQTEHLRELPELAQRVDRGERLLLAIGARRLAEAVGHSQQALHHARVLPQAAALRLAMAAGLPAERVACLRPTDEGRIESGLCRHWGIETVCCRQSGGVGEAMWQQVCSDLGLRLLLLVRPAEPAGVACLPLPELLISLGRPPA